MCSVSQTWKINASNRKTESLDVLRSLNILTGQTQEYLRYEYTSIVRVWDLLRKQ
jgi:hypothetical protein